MLLVLIFIIAVIMYRVLISIPLFENKELRPKASTIASMSAAVVNLVIIMMLGRVYEKLALKLTQWGELMFPSSQFLLYVLLVHHQKKLTPSKMKLIFCCPMLVHRSGTFSFIICQFSCLHFFLSLPSWFCT